MVARPHERAQVRAMLDLAIGNEALWADRNFLSDDRVLDLGPEANSHRTTDQSSPSYQCVITNYAVLANLHRTFDVGPWANDATNSD